MIVRISLLASLLVISTIAFECSPDTILRMATNKREKQLERECHEVKTGQEVCETKDELEKSWKEFQEVSDDYKKAVAECRKYVEEKSRPKRFLDEKESGPVDSEEANEKTREKRRKNYEDIDSKLYDSQETETVGKVYETIEKARSKTKRQLDGTVLDGDMGDPTDGQETNDHARRRRHHNHDGHQNHGEKHHENMDHHKHGNHHGRVRRNGDHDPNDPNIDHTGHNHRRKRSTDDDPSDTTIDHTGHNHRMRRSHDDDPSDTTIDHTGHNHRRRRSGDHDPNDPNIDHTGHNHRRKRNHDDDPSDTTIDHTGHNHRRRRSGDHDPNDPDIDHTGHNHRRRRSHDDDPNDTTIDHTGHNHRRRRSGDHDPNDPDIDHSGHNHRRRRHHQASRIRRTVCSTAGSEQLSAMSSKFSKHCERENICLPDEDLPKGKQQDAIVALQKERAKKYSAYLTQVSKCYGKL
ncbi:hypothetical protein GCK72_005404 [Caenorhabditis remanei]|uniref:Uncharacterized protein n=1 Tax=Caenorhabditis remanei TaxID=31234 RepID=A0A6A5HHB5_CAERE|nr:hypothetical protein GCK72_005404 [Caenorhabditis remanei]KAF1765452.1 hypothetical protein GCK72_005404 [Caenorhabditis remanei]